MASVMLHVGDTQLECRSLTGHERLGEPARFEVEIFSPEPVETASVMGQACQIRVETDAGARTVAGVVARWSALATSQSASARRYRASVYSVLAVGDLRRNSRVYQHLPVPEIIKELLGEGGYAAEAIVTSLAADHPEREYVVQYAETDAAFIRRLCEEEGLYFSFGVADSGLDAFELWDTSTSAPPAYEDALLVVDDSELQRDRPAVSNCRLALRRRPGKVTLRDYDYERPAVQLEGVAQGGNDVERSVEVYEAPGGFKAQREGAARATQRIESLRADAKVLSFHTTAVRLRPGCSFSLELGPSYAGAARPEGDFLVVGVKHTHHHDSRRYGLTVEAIPLDVPFRLPRTSPRAQMGGVHTAKVTGSSGEEIHTDRQGRIKVRFPWDREGPEDDKSSLPVRVMQPNTPGSMVIPRVGWEILVMFEDGDPDRPFVLGRTYNAKSPPPMSLPANKTMTALLTLASPGGARQNAITFDDAAGRQHVAIAAGFNKTMTVANNMLTQTVKNENIVITGSQGRSVGSSEDVSVTQGLLSAVGSQSATVGGMQKIWVKGFMTVAVGSETVLVGGAVLEKVGDPVSGLKSLAVSAAISGAGQLGTIGGLVSKGATRAQAGYRGYQQGGFSGMLRGVGGAAAGVVAAMIPGGEAVLSQINSSLPVPWKDPPPAAGSQEVGGGGSGASSSSSTGGPGLGYRITNVKGAMTEIIGSNYAMVTPGSSSWSTVGPSTLLIGGSHSTKALTASFDTLGASTETLGSLSIKTSGQIVRSVSGAISTTIAGALNSKAGGKHVIRAEAALKIKVGGSLTMTGSHVTFVCGESKVIASSGGIVLEAPKIKVSRGSKQSKETTHA
ncbi:type VI secretion system Vgr family protein [Sorangium sp. So ce362]|uniref:type VI secretion system Vgr family protein n=1 Tax=Sorangium sp. So ce362 TaxID=3133303 RepID=UPI003F5F6409